MIHSFKYTIQFLLCENRHKAGMIMLFNVFNIQISAGSYGDVWLVF
jgi:hypothetical protein